MNLPGQLERPTSPLGHIQRALFPRLQIPCYVRIFRVVLDFCCCHRPIACASRLVPIILFLFLLAIGKKAKSSLSSLLKRGGKKRQRAEILMNDRYGWRRRDGADERMLFFFLFSLLLRLEEVLYVHVDWNTSTSEMVACLISLDIRVCVFVGRSMG